MSERSVDQYNVGQLVSGESLAGRTLFVAAVHGEAERLPKNVPLLVTGIGTVPTAISVATVLARAQAQGAMPHASSTSAPLEHFVMASREFMRSTA